MVDKEKYMLPRNICLSFHIDTNCINARNSIEDINVLEQWSRNGVISIDMSKVAFNEAHQGHSASRKEKAKKYIYTHTHASTEEERSTLRKIQQIIFPEGANTPNEKNDVEIVFNSNKYGCILITNDGDSKKQPGGILGNANQLKQELDIHTLGSEAAVDLVREKIKTRDTQCKEISESFDKELPEWVGVD